VIGVTTAVCAVPVATVVRAPDGASVGRVWPVPLDVHEAKTSVASRSGNDLIGSRMMSDTGIGGSSPMNAGGVVEYSRVAGAE
jgi:hypothetical protein